MSGERRARATRRAAAVLVLALGPLAFGCASYTEETREIRSLYKADAFGSALKKLDESDIKEQSKNRLLYRLEKAMILDRLGETAKSRALLIEADKLADELYTESISRNAASFVVNDAVMDYSGEDYEKVAIHTQLALSFIGDHDLAAARVEAVKINNKLHEITQKYDAGHNRYAEDAFARYLAGAVYEARGDLDDAIIDYTKALALYNGSYRENEFVIGGVPDSLVRSLYRLVALRHRDDRRRQLEEAYPQAIAEAKADLAHKGDAYVIVFHELGHIAVKTTQEFVFPFGKQVIRFSFPVINKRHHQYLGGTRVSDQTSGASATADNVQDMDAIAHWCLDDRRGRMLLKESARLIAKGQLTEQAYKNFGLLGGIAANIYSVVSETADTRSWTLLPEAYFISRLRLAPGHHVLRLETGSRTSKMEALDLRPGQVVLLRSFD